MAIIRIVTCARCQARANAGREELPHDWYRVQILDAHGMLVEEMEWCPGCYAAVDDWLGRVEADGALGEENEG